MFNRGHFGPDKVDPAFNPNRTADLFDLTDDGYIIAQDIACQQEFMNGQCCPNCDRGLMSIAQINRAFQGLNEIVALCTGCREHFSFIFDISNEVYQEWWAGRMGDAYVLMYDGSPRTPNGGHNHNTHLPDSFD